ncbi:MAG: hypothetical protein RL685_3275 [Pseudomonadota bacterium]|jgi:hypothetical protein
MGLDLTRGGAPFAALDHEAQDREPHGMPESTELLGMVFQLGRHDAISANIEVAGKVYFE